MRRRIVICLGLLLALCLLGDVIAMLCLHRSIGQLSRLAESHRIQSMRAELASGGARIETDLHAFLTGNAHTAEQQASSIRRFDKALSRCGACHHKPLIRGQLDAIEATFNAYRVTSAQLFSAGATEDEAVLKERAIGLADRMVAQTSALADLAAEHLSTRSADVKASIHNAWLVLLGTLLAVLVFGGVVAFHLKHRLTKPVEALLEGIERVRQGDLSHRFSFKADQEFRELADAFNQAYTDLKRAQEGALQAERLAAVGKLAAGVAHEVGNPLASISSIAQLMRRRSQSKEEADRLDLIMEQIARISRIVHELLTFSRPASETGEDLVEITALLDRATTLLKYDKRSERINIVCDHDADLRTIRGDADRLLLVFTNIMLNAFDAMGTERQAAGTLTITTRQRADHILVSFKDTGAGMGKEQIAHAFEPFYTTKAPGEGTGLGLWICYQVIQERHNGHLRIESQLGEGTTVTVMLPCPPVEDHLTDDETAGVEDRQHVEDFAAPPL